MKHFKEKINREVTGSNDYKDSVLQQIRTIITSNTLEQYQANFEKLENIAPGKFIDYYQKIGRVTLRCGLFFMSVEVCFT